MAKSLYSCILYEPVCPCGELEKDYHESLDKLHKEAEQTLKDVQPNNSISDPLKRQIDYQRRYNAVNKEYINEEKRITYRYRNDRHALEDEYCIGCGWDEFEIARRREESKRCK